MAFGETEQSWRRFIRQLKERGLSGVELATSDAHEGLKRALEDGFHEATAVLALPEKYRKRLRTTNMLERFIQEIRSRERQDPVRASKEEPAQSRNVVAH
jgi:transposase-like protein